MSDGEAHALACRPPSYSGAGTILFGGSGFLGPYILESHPEMVSVGRRPPPTPNRHISVETLADLDAIREVEFDSVIYIVGNTDHHNLERPELPRGQPNAFDYHTIPLLQVLEQLKHRPLRKFVHFSTVLIYDEHRITLPVNEDAPIDPYKNRYVLSKYLAEEACKFFGHWVPIINVRMSNLYGPSHVRRFDLVHQLINQLLDEGRGEVWTKEPARDFIYVEDAARAIVDLLATDYTGTVNLGTGTMTSVREVTDLLEDMTGCPIADLGRPVAGPARFQCDTSTLERLIGWRPRFPIAEGLQRTLESMKR